MTIRQRQIFHRLVRGLSHKQIGAELGISEGTARNHAVELHRKLNVKSRAELIHWWLQNPEDAERGVVTHFGLHKAGCNCEACANVDALECAA